MKQRAWLWVSSVLVMLSAVSASAQVDERVRQALDQAELNYTELDNGNFRLHYTLEDDRTHLVIVESQTSKMGAMEIRDIWGIGWKGMQKPTAEAANKMLQDSGLKKVGAWELHKEADGTFFAIFNVKAPASSDSATLKELASAVAAVADNMEKSLQGSDQF